VHACQLLQRLMRTRRQAPDVHRLVTDPSDLFTTRVTIFLREGNVVLSHTQTVSTTTTLSKKSFIHAQDFVAKLLLFVDGISGREQFQIAPATDKWSSGEEELSALLPDDNVPLSEAFHLFVTGCPPPPSIRTKGAVESPALPMPVVHRYNHDGPASPQSPIRVQPAPVSTEEERSPSVSRQLSQTEQLARTRAASGNTVLGRRLLRPLVKRTRPSEDHNGRLTEHSEVCESRYSPPAQSMAMLQTPPNGVISASPDVGDTG